MRRTEPAPNISIGVVRRSESDETTPQMDVFEQPGKVTL